MWLWLLHWLRGSCPLWTGPGLQSTKKPLASTGRFSPLTRRWRVMFGKLESFIRWADCEIKGQMHELKSRRYWGLPLSAVGLFMQVIIRGGGHILPYDQPQRSFDMIDRFLSTQGWKWKARVEKCNCSSTFTLESTSSTDRWFKTDCHR